MQPSTKIIIGATLALSGYHLGSMADAHLFRRNLEAKSNIEKLVAEKPNSSSSKTVSLPSTNSAIPALLVGILQGLGIMLFIIGTYQNAKSTERLIESPKR